jgi:signal peptidase I
MLPINLDENVGLFFKALLNALCPGAISLCKGQYLLFIISYCLPFLVLIFVCQSGYVFSDNGISVLIALLLITFIVLSLVACVKYSSINNISFGFKSAVLIVLVLVSWYSILFFIIKNKSTILGVDIYQIYAVSMEPALHHGEFVLAEVNPENYRENDIVFFKMDSLGPQTNVKRIYALEGDEVNLPPNKKAFIVPEQEVFLLGDNSNSSIDSRKFGTIKIQFLKARAVRVYRNGQWVLI